MSFYNICLFICTETVKCTYTFYLFSSNEKTLPNTYCSIPFMHCIEKPNFTNRKSRGGCQEPGAVQNAELLLSLGKMLQFCKMKKDSGELMWTMSIYFRFPKSIPQVTNTENFMLCVILPLLKIILVQWDDTAGKGMRFIFKTHTVKEDSQLMHVVLWRPPMCALVFVCMLTFIYTHTHAHL